MKKVTAEKFVDDLDDLMARIDRMIGQVNQAIADLPKRKRSKDQAAPWWKRIVGD